MSVPRLEWRLFLELLEEELQGFNEAVDQRAYLIEAAQHAFDVWIKPLDLPGPDGLFDPVLRAAIAPLVGLMFDRLAEKAGTSA